MDCKTILVTGGAGFIGSNFVLYLSKKYPDYKIVNLDALTYAASLDNLKEMEDSLNYTFIKGNICDTVLVDKTFKIYKPNFVINFAAESHVDRSIEDPQIFVKTNVLGTQVLLEACKKYWLASSEPKMCALNKYLQVSTDEVYGSLGSTGYFTEESPIAPNSPYSASKAAADMFVRAYHETYGLNVNITRCSNNYGPRQHLEKLIPMIINNALNNMEIPVYGDGINIRDWLYVEDHCRAINLVLHQGKPGEVYNIGGSNERTNIEIVRMVLKELGKSETLIKYVKDRPGHDRRYAIDAKKITAELGWKSETNFEIKIKETIAWNIRNYQKED